MKTPKLKTNFILCLLMMFLGSKVKAQEGKPTKEETIVYITNFFKETMPHDLHFTEDDKYHERVYKVFDRFATLESSGQQVILKSHSKKQTQIYPKKIHTIPPPEVEDISHNVILNDVEEIKIVGYFGIGGLFFKTKGDPGGNNKFLALWPADEHLSTARETQVYKAFQHLRKLLGAPEPLKF